MKGLFLCPQTLASQSAQLWHKLNQHWKTKVIATSTLRFATPRRPVDGDRRKSLTRRPLISSNLFAVIDKASEWTVNRSLLLRPEVQWKLMLGCWQAHIFKRTYTHAHKPSWWIKSCCCSLQAIYSSTKVYDCSIINAIYFYAFMNILVIFHRAERSIYKPW